MIEHVPGNVTSADENQGLFGEAGAIDALVATMRAHVGNAGVMEAASQAITNICFQNGAFVIHLLAVVTS